MTSWSRAAVGIAVLCVLVVTSRLAAAHGERTATLTIEITSATEARLSADAGLTLEAPGCSLDPEPRPLRALRCRGGTGGEEVTVRGLGRSIDLVIVHVVPLRGAQQGSTLTARAPTLVLPDDAPLSGTALRFVRLGCEHVFSGLDHLLFLLALCCQAWSARGGSLRQSAAELLWTATTFTVAHSVTLAATVLGWLHVPASAAEACIGLSLVLVALEPRSRDNRAPTRLLLVFAFGAVHGLGFAGALTSARLPSDAVVVGLLSFNAGVEIAQVVVFAGGLSLMALLRRTRWGAARPRLDIVTSAAAYAIGSAGVAMFLHAQALSFEVDEDMLHRTARLVVALVLTIGASGAVVSPAFAQGRDGEGAPEPAPEPKKEAPANPSPTPDVIQPSPPKPGPVTPDTTKPWSLTAYGYLRAGYDRTNPDPRFEFVGRNNGFVLESARVGVEGRNRDYDVGFRVSMEGASDVLSAPNTPIGTLAVRLRDAFARWDPIPWLGVQAGQYKAPFQEEELRGTPDLMFASRAVGVEGVPPARGFQTPGIQLDRQLGVMLSPSKPIGGDLGIAYYLMVMNGNGSNQLLDDNGRFGLVARSEIGYLNHVRFGAALFRNDRTMGAPPNLYNEEDLGLTGDLAVKVAGLEAFGAVTRVRTVFPTIGTDARVQLAFHGQVAYRIELPSFFFAPGYRYAYFHPWQEGGAEEGFDSFKLQYHTFGVRAGATKLPLQGWLNYTVATEGDGRKLDNDRIELLGQVTF